jgi:predicted ribosomally synthesized peptide with SipW-like signal peptide
MKNTKKLIVAIAALSILLCCAVGGTLAYLRDKTDTVTNTFTYGDINITLDESKDLNLKMIPGGKITKDPTVTVDPTSEACYLFVKIDASAAVANYLEYDVDSAWTRLEGVENVYYMVLETVPQAPNNEFPILKNNQVTVKTTVTKEMMEAVKANAKLVELSFTAYAVQKENVADVTTAWSIANGN